MCLDAATAETFVCLLTGIFIWLSSVMTAYITLTVCDDVKTRLNEYRRRKSLTEPAPKTPGPNNFDRPHIF